MKITRTAMAIVAAGALVLAGCTSDSGDGGGDNGGDNANGEGGGGGGAGEDGSKPKLDITETADDQIYYSPGEVEWNGYNDALSSTNSTYNTAINGRMQSGFYYFGTQGQVVHDPDFGSYEKTSDDPLTVKYTINEEAKWEDGTPITCDDAVLSWASQNPKSLSDGGDPLFNSVSIDFGEKIAKGPDCESGDKEFEIVFDEPFADWEIMISGFFPAHVVAKEVGLETADLTKAFRDGKDGENFDKVKEAAKFFNGEGGWVSKTPGQLPDKAIAPSSGPYTLSSWEAGQTLSLEPNKNWWGAPPATKTLTYRFVAADTHVRALTNGDLNIIEPQATIDTLEQLEAIGDGVQVDVGDTMTWEHVDFNFRDSSIFSEKKGGLELRQAFAHCLPRQQIVDQLIKPLDEDAQIMNLRETFPFQEGYDEAVKASGYDGKYDEVDIDKAKELVEKSGEKKLDVRIGYSQPNPRRSQIVSAIKASCDQAGFNVIDAGSADFFKDGGPLDAGDWEVALFAWAGSGQKTSGRPIYSTPPEKGGPGTQNYGQNSDKKVDEAWNELQTILDDDEMAKKRGEIEGLLWENLQVIPLFAHPGVTGYDATIENVIPTAAQSQIVWNAEQWKRN